MGAKKLEVCLARSWSGAPLRKDAWFMVKYLKRPLMPGITYEHFILKYNLWKKRVSAPMLDVSLSGIGTIRSRNY